MRISVDVDEDDVLREFEDEALTGEMDRRKLKGHQSPAKALELIYEEFRRRGDAPEILREYIYDNLGRILP